MEKVTTQTILDWIVEQVESKVPIAPSLWIDASMKLTALVGNENDKLIELQQIVAELRKMRIENGDSVAKAKVYVEATKEYGDMCRQKARIEQIYEMIRLSKVRARMEDDNFKSN